ncbi:MAG TPA: hypothetical protein VK666_11875 [Chryseolinea sp.]|nr:hypothetical protein [Chryseolinea sp.]
MTTDLKDGARVGLTIWVIGIVLTIVVHVIFGWKNPHSPPASSIIVFVGLIIVLIRLVSNAYRILFDINKDKNKGEIIIHLFGAVIMTIFVFINLD